jgi:hypothetical protein
VNEAVTARTTTALRVIVGLSLVAACIMALAETGDGAPLPTAVPAFGGDEPSAQDLERIFWACDRAASTIGVSGSEGMACSDATEQLRLRKFAGDFDAMLEWWRANKSAAYQAFGQPEPGIAAAEEFPQP